MPSTPTPPTPPEVAPYPRRLTPEETEKHEEAEAIRILEDRLREKQEQLARLETTILLHKHYMNEAARNGDMATAEQLLVVYTDLLLEREELREGYKLINKLYEIIADGTGHNIPADIRDFDPLKPGYFVLPLPYSRFR